MKNISKNATPKMQKILKNSENSKGMQTDI